MEDWPSAPVNGRTEARSGGSTCPCSAERDPSRSRSQHGAGPKVIDCRLFWPGLLAVSEQGTPGASGPAGLGPLTVAEALDRLQRGTGGTCVKVRAHVLKVEVGVTGVDPADAGYGDLIEVGGCGSALSLG